MVEWSNQEKKLIKREKPKEKLEVTKEGDEHGDRMNKTPLKTQKKAHQTDDSKAINSGYSS